MLCFDSIQQGWIYISFGCAHKEVPKNVLNNLCITLQTIRLYLINAVEYHFLSQKNDTDFLVNVQ